MLNLIDDINKIWLELQHEKVRMKHQEEHLQEILQNAFDEVSSVLLGNYYNLNPLTPTSDQQKTSPYNILTLSSKKVMRMFKLIS